MMNVNVNVEARTIEMTQNFAKKAGQYNSEEYFILRDIRADYSNFRIVIKKSANKGDRMKGLTHKYMKEYILGHKKELLGEFYELCGLDEDGKKTEGFGVAASYGEIKKWFLQKCPEVNKKSEEKMNRINEILGKNAA